MMTSGRLLRYVATEPFQPFRIKMTGGDTLEIRYADMVFVGRTMATIFPSLDDWDENPHQGKREISIRSIDSIEAFCPPPP